MQKLLLPILFLGLVLNFANAQKKESVIINLENEKNTIFTEQFQIDSVIDNRALKQHWGIAQVGLGNRKVPVLIEDGAAGIQKYLKKNILSGTPNTKKLVLIINHLWISERAGTLSEIGLCELDASFCLRNKDGKLESIFDFDEEIEAIGLNDVTDAHQVRLIKMLSKAIKKVDVLELSVITPQPFVFATLDTINNILKSEPKKGFFKTFVDLYNNTPDQKPEIEIISINNDGTRYKLKNKTTKQRVKNYFAFSDGRNIYLNSFSYGMDVASYYTYVESKGRFMVVDDEYINPHLSAISVNFLPIGALAAKATSIRGMAVDMKTGMPLYFSDEKFDAMLAKEYPDHFIDYAREPKKGKYVTKLKYMNIINNL